MATSRKPVPPENDPEPETPVAPVAPEPDPEPAETPKPAHTLLNPGTASCVYNTQGQSLGGGECVDVDEIDEVGQAALDRGYLVEK